MTSRFRFLSELGLAVLPTGGTNTGKRSTNSFTFALSHAVASAPYSSLSLEVPLSMFILIEYFVVF